MFHHRLFEHLVRWHSKCWGGKGWSVGGGGFKQQVPWDGVLRQVENVQAGLALQVAWFGRSSQRNRWRWYTPNAKCCSRSGHDQQRRQGESQGNGNGGRAKCKRGWYVRPSLVLCKGSWVVLAIFARACAGRLLPI